MITEVLYAYIYMMKNGKCKLPLVITPKCFSSFA